MPEEFEDSIKFAIEPDDLIVIKVIGRGTFKNSVGVKQLAEKLISEGKSPKFIFDLNECISMDSTFMGVLAGIGKNQITMKLGKTIAINLNQQTDRLLKTLGLNYILDIREPSRDSLNDNIKYIQQQSESLPKHEQIIHMLEAHQTLIDLDTNNEARFQNVIFYLKDSLSKEKRKEDGYDTDNSEI